MGEPIETDGDGNQLTLMDIIDDGTDLPEMVDTLMQSKQLYQYLQQFLTRGKRKFWCSGTGCMAVLL